MQVWRVRPPQLEEPPAHCADEDETGQEEVEEIAIEPVAAVAVGVHVDGPEKGCLCDRAG